MNLLNMWLNVFSIDPTILVEVCKVVLEQYVGSSRHTTKQMGCRLFIDISQSDQDNQYDIIMNSLKSKSIKVIIVQNIR